MSKPTRPETGACEAMAVAYSQDLEPCHCRATIHIAGKKLCRTHASKFALQILYDRGEAHNLPVPGNKRTVTFIEHEE